MDGQGSRKLFEQVINLLKNGSESEAENLCRSQLAEYPRDVNFLSLLGSISLRKNDFAMAEKSLKTVAEIAPGYPRVQEDLGTVLLNMGRPQEAILPLQKAIEQNPQNATAFFKLGGALKSLGRDEAGDAALKMASELPPAQANLERATQLFAQGKFRESEEIAKKILEDNPREVNAGLLLGRIAIHARAFKQAEKLLKRVIKIAPKFILAWHELSNALREQGKDEEAIELLEEALLFDTENATTHYQLAAALAVAGRTADSASAYKQAVQIDPNLVGAYLGLGHTLKTMGDLEGGIAAYKQARKLKPNIGEISFSLSNLKTFRFSDLEIEDMKRRLNNPNLDQPSKVAFSFSLGKAYEDMKKYDEAFEFYLRGNEIHRSLVTYDPVQTEVSNEKLKEVFSKDFFDKLDSSKVGNSDPSPIFIVGMPRSGSTLLEQILASHSQVDGTRELPDLGIVSQMLNNRERGTLYPGGIRKMKPSEIFELGKTYLDRAERHRVGAPFFTDKMPNNFAHIGLIATILPNAKIIDARRHPLDSCVGCFKQHWALGQTYTYDMFELGEFYLEYDSLMSHWESVLPGKVLRVQYEDVIDDLETQVRSVLSFCNLPFEDSCLNFHKTKRSVATASSEQVRQPIYNKSVNSWKRFESHIEPLIEILEPILDTSDLTKIVR